MAEVGSRKDPFGRSARQLLMATYTGTNFHLLVNSTVYQKEEENTIHVIIKLRHHDWLFGLCALICLQRMIMSTFLV